MDRKFLIIDGYNIIYRAFFALMNGTGKTTSVSVFFTSMLNLLKQTDAEYLAVCMDSRGDTLRKKDYAQYKANREKTPPELHKETDEIRFILSSFGIPVVSEVGYEADDLICSLQGKYCNDAEIYIASGDKDLLQLVSNDKGVFQLRCDAKEDRWVIYDDDKVIERYGLPPTKIASYLALLGDSSDNVPGVAGIGEKSARELLSSYENIDDIYKNIEALKPAVRKKIESGKSDAYASLKLVSLSEEEYRYDLKNDCLEDYSIGKINAASGISALEEAGYIRVAGQMRKYMRDKGLIKENDARSGNANTSKAQNGNDASGKSVLCEAANISSVEMLIEKSDEISVLLDKTASNAFFSLNDGKTFVLQIADDKIKSKFAALIADNAGKIVTINAKELYKLSKKTCDSSNGFIDDINVESYLLDSTRAQETIPYLARTHLGENLYRKSAQEPSLFSTGDDADSLRTNAEYAAAILRIHRALHEKLKKEDLLKTYEEIEKPLIPIISGMELAGIYINSNEIRKIESKLKEEVQKLEKQIYGIVGHEFNIQSPKQLQDALANDMRIPLAKKTHTGFSTDQQTLEELAGSYEVIELVLEYKAKVKLLQTYTVSLLDEIDPSDNRLHTTFLQTGTQTGRFSSVRPNLQNIPARTQEGNLIRGCFTAANGCKLISCDYSQIELRVLAHLSRDDALCGFFKEDLDVHRATAAALKGVDYHSDSITDKDRSSAKTINFAVIYGMSAFSLAKILKISGKDAQKFIDSYFELFKGVVELKNRIIETAKDKGYVITEFGRKRYLNDITSPNRILMQKAERQALNSTIQGEAADIMKIAMRKAADAIKGNNMDVRILLTVHDEIISEAKEDCVKDAKALIKAEMENAVKLTVPLKANASDSKTWGSI
ncbi:MAG TPA: DNA polymerase I [Spirochaetaceae bacterium]|nr:DNA polymerase I [Spirochaetaceae bacterium]